jgi:hypothetical protein
MTTVTLEVNEQTLDGKQFLSFLETLGYVSILSPNNKRKQPEKKTYTAIDFLDEWSGAFEQLDGEDLDDVKYQYLIEKYK